VAALNMKTDMVLDALEMARVSRGGHRLIGLVTHSDAGSQFTSVRFTERLEEIGARPSIGTVADSYDTQGMIVTVDVGSSGLTRLTTGGPEGSDPSYDWRHVLPTR
jgi:transposase InsO family protein